MNIIIKGGEFNNKGAEAMSLIAIYNIRKSFPNANIYFYDVGLPYKYGKDIDIEFFSFPLWVFMYKLGLINKRVYLFNKIKNYLKLFIPNYHFYSEKAIQSSLKIIKNADLFIDISGFALSSKWDIINSFRYISWIDFLKKNKPSCKIYLMPQSFGPFDFDEAKNNIIKDSLAKCDKIFAREIGGYKDLTEKFGLNNVCLSYDSVLLEKDYSPEKVISNIEKYIEKPEKVCGRKVAIIPNYRLIDKGNNSIETLISLYSEIINKANPKIHFYLIPHAGEDIQLCKLIKERFSDNGKVILIDHVLASFNYENFISDFDYIIASRYHSIIHAYRQGTPAIIIGWSEKYDELAKAFDQTKYIYDLKGNVNILDYINKIELNYKKDRDLINRKLPIIQQNNCYEFLENNRC